MTSAWNLSWGTSWANSWGQAQPVILPSKSGYNRLLLIQLQEEALRQYEEKRKKPDAEKIVEPIAKPKPVRKVEVPAARERFVREPIAPGSVSRRRFPAIRFQPTQPDQFEQLPQTLSLWSQELYGWYQQHEPLRLLGIELQRQLATEAANDEDEEDEEDVLLLLMAA